MLFLKRKPKAFGVMIDTGSHKEVITPELKKAGNTLVLFEIEKSHDYEFLVVGINVSFSSGNSSQTICATVKWYACIPSCKIYLRCATGRSLVLLIQEQNSSRNCSTDKSITRSIGWAGNL